MREGRDPQGRPLYPAFPYTSYTRMTDEDLAALKAYLDALPAVSQALETARSLVPVQPPLGTLSLAVAVLHA